MQHKQINWEARGLVAIPLGGSTFLGSIEDIYRTESRRVLATLIRLLGDFDLAEEALQDAFTSATEAWPRDGVPANPRAWLVSTGRFKAIDRVRRRARFDVAKPELIERFENVAALNAARPDEIEDDSLRLIFTCCHPAIAPQLQVALTLREVCGLTTEEIASAFLTSTTTMAQRIVRGKAKIRDAGIPFALPPADDFPERLDAVLAVTYLVFNEGYAASSGQSLTRSELSQEAIRLGRLVVELLPEPEAMGLLALMLLQESRRAARTDQHGDLILLEAQNRSLWNRTAIQEGSLLVQRALSTRRAGPYSLQAAIASIHATAPTAAQTDWPQIVAIYDALLAIHPSPVIELNRAVAISMRDGPRVALGLIELILQRGDLQEYHLAHAAKADMLRKLGDTAEAASAYRLALSLTKQEPERRFLAARLAKL